MKIAIPVANEKLCMHFGHCEVFKIYDINENEKIVNETKSVEPPPHEPGKLPIWIKEQGVDLVLAGGIGQRAKQLLLSHSVNVISGIEGPIPNKIIIDFMNNNLAIGDNACNH